VHIHYGIQIVSVHKERGYTRDAAIGISNKSSSTTTWRDGIIFGSSNGANPLGSDSRVLFVEDQGGIRGGFEIPECSQFIVKSGAVTIGNSSTTLGIAGYVFDIGSLTNAGSVRYDYNTSGVTTDYDARVLVSGGSATTGRASYTITAGSIALTAATEVSVGSVLRPSSDNAINLGIVDRRWATIYAGTGTINTSDEREKTELLDFEDAEKAAALEIKKSIRKFKFKNAVNAKGESARIHFGVGAQTVKSILEKQGLDPFSYAFLCYDEWEELPEIKEIVDDAEVVTQEYRAAGNRYGIRYDELAMFILGAL
jgi:hypothetical protein